MPYNPYNATDDTYRSNFGYLYNSLNPLKEDLYQGELNSEMTIDDDDLYYLQNP